MSSCNRGPHRESQAYSADFSAAGFASRHILDSVIEPVALIKAALDAGAEGRIQLVGRHGNDSMWNVVASAPR